MSSKKSLKFILIILYSVFGPIVLTIKSRRTKIVVPEDRLLPLSSRRRCFRRREKRNNQRSSSTASADSEIRVTYATFGTYANHRSIVKFSFSATTLARQSTRRQKAA